MHQSILIKFFLERLLNEWSTFGFFLTKMLSIPHFCIVKYFWRTFNFHLCWWILILSILNRLWIFQGWIIFRISQSPRCWYRYYIYCLWLQKLFTKNFSQLKTLFLHYVAMSLLSESFLSWLDSFAIFKQFMKCWSRCSLASLWSSLIPFWISTMAAIISSNAIVSDISKIMDCS